MPSCKAGGTVKSRVVKQRGGNMVLHSGATTQTRGTKRKRSSIAKQSKFQQHLPLASNCVVCLGKDERVQQMLLLPDIHQLFPTYMSSARVCLVICMNVS